MVQVKYHEFLKCFFFSSTLALKFVKNVLFVSTIVSLCYRYNGQRAVLYYTFTFKPFDGFLYVKATSKETYLFNNTSETQLFFAAYSYLCVICYF